MDLGWFGDVMAVGRATTRMPVAMLGAVFMLRPLIEAYSDTVVIV